MTDVNEIEAEAKKAIDSEEYDRALELYESLAGLHHADGYFYAGLIYEKGLSSRGVSTDRAFEFFTRLINEYNDSEGYLGCARIQFNRPDGDRREAVEYCKKAISLSGNPFAHLLLGRTRSENGEHQAARRHYLKAIVGGAAWGMRLYSHSFMQQRRFVLGILCHAATTMFFPFFVLFGGKKAVRFD